MTGVVIAEAVRTAVGSFGGDFSEMPAIDLGASVIRALLDRTGLGSRDVDETIMGQVLTAGLGQNPARQAHVKAGLDVHSTAFGVNQLCGSGLRSVMIGAQQIMTGQAHTIIAGGMENMSRAMYATPLRPARKMGHLEMIDTMIHDGLWDAFHDYHMGITAENIAARYEITRAEQDLFALTSQNRAEAAQESGKFAREIIPVSVETRKGLLQVSQDGSIRAGMTLEALQRLKPAFDPSGTVTAGNSSGLNDGAAGVVLMSKTTARTRQITPLAYIRSFATAGVAPEIMGLGPVYASKKALSLAGWEAGDLDLIESNEAFAAQACAVNRLMNFDSSRVNVNGGAIAIGHPIGASGARVLVTLLHEMQRRDSQRGLATLCIGGGMGVAMCIERPRGGM